MLALGLLLNFAGIGLFCWLIFTLAVYALPFFVGLYVACWPCTAAPASSAAPLVGIAAGGMTLAIGQIAFAMTRSLIFRAIIAAAVCCCRRHLLAIRSFLRCRKSACRRWSGARSSPVSARSLSAARRGRG